MSPPFNQSNAKTSSADLPQPPRNINHEQSAASMSLLGLQSRRLAHAWRDEGASSSSPRSNSLRSITSPNAAATRGGSSRAVTREEHLVSVIDEALSLFADPSSSPLTSSSSSPSSSGHRGAGRRNDSDRNGDQEGRQ